MGTIPAPDIFRDTLDEYTRSAQLNQSAEQLRQNQAIDAQNIAASKQTMQRQAELAPSGQLQAEQNAQATQLENQQRQLALQQQQAALGAQKKNLKKDDSGKIIGFDNEGYQRDALAAGVPLPVITSQQQAITEAASKAAGLTKDQLANHETELDQHFQSIEGLRKIPAGPQREQAYHQIVNKAGMAGDDISEYPTQIGDDNNVDQIEAHLGMTKQALNQAKEISEINKNNQTTSAARIEQRYLDIQQRKNEGQKISPEDAAFSKGYEHNKELVPAFNVKMGVTGAGMIPTAPAAGGPPPPPPTVESVPNSIKGTVQQIIDYRAQLPPAGRNNPTNSAIRYWVNALDPQHDDTTFPARNKLMTNLTSGSGAKSIGAINTALGHAGILSDAIDALDNNNVPLLAAVANKIGVAVGSTPQTTLETIVHRIGPELAAAYIEGGGSAGERGTTEEDFSLNKGGAQLKKNVAITAQLLRSKIASTENQYKQTMGRDDFQKRFITPEAQATLDKLSPQGGSGGASAGHIIKIGKQRYQYKGSGSTADLSNYNPL